jgi:hypothetical protein
MGAVQPRFQQRHALGIQRLRLAQQRHQLGQRQRRQLAPGEAALPHPA